MSANIACSFPGCTNPVIGQCAGYKKSCGRYYCREHSTDTLCADCAKSKVNDPELIYQDYVVTAEGLEKEARTTITYKALWKKGVKITAIIGLVAGPIFLPIMAQPQDFLSGVGYFFLGFLAGPVFLVCDPYLIFGSLIVWIVCGVKRGNWHKEIGIKRATEIDKSKPGFLEFYTDWRKEKSKEKLMTVLTIVGAVAAVGVATAVSNMGNTTDDKIRDHESKYH